MEVVIQKLDHFGRGICYIDSKICFVEGALPNERVIIEIVKETKNFIEARCVHVILESPDRVKPICPYFGECGGCSLQYMSYSLENKFKEEKVKDIVSRFGNISPDIVLPIVHHQEYNYRNKITLHGNGSIMGLYKNDSHDIVPIEKCHLVLPSINEMIPKIPNMKECIIKSSNDGKNILTSMDKGELITTIGDYQYYQSISSFFQVNSTLTKELYDEVLRSIQEIQPNQLLDLYCGTGTIGIYVSKYCNSIIGVDYNSSNIHDACKNAEMNHIANIDFICDKVENVIDQFQDIDCVIVDPPRSGLDNKTKDFLKTIASSSIIYVSCDPATMARDLKDLSDSYDVKYIKPFNMFPRTSHVETVSVLCRKTIEK